MLKAASKVRIGDRLMSCEGAPMVREILAGKVPDVVGFRVTGGRVIWSRVEDMVKAKRATTAEKYYESL